MKWICGLMVVFLASCAGVSDKKEQTFINKKPVDSESSVAIGSQSIEPEFSTEKETAISQDVLYLLLTAEIAGQRNQFDLAFDGYLQAAKRVNDPIIAKKAAHIGLFLKDKEKTDEAVSLWLQRDEKNMVARKVAILSALQNADQTAAVEHLSRILKDNPAGFESVLMELAKVLRKEGSSNFLFDSLEALSKIHSDQAVVFFVQALLAGEMRKDEIAQEKINRALTLQPDWDKALIFQAQLASQQSDLVLARRVLERVLKKTPNNQRVRKMLSQVLVKSKAFDEAIQLYQDILKSEPDEGNSQLAIALIYLQQENNDKAATFLKKLVNKPKWAAPAHFYLGRIEYNKENYRQALVWFDKVKQGNYAYDAAMAAVSSLLNQKNFAEVEQRLVHLSIQFPEQQLNILLLQAEMYNGQKNYQKTFELLSDALKQFPEHKEILYTRALVAEKLDKLAVLETDLRKILSKHPNDASALNALGYTLADRTQRYDEAEVYLQQAIKIKPDEAVIIDSIGWLYFKRGELDKALMYLRDAHQKQAEAEISAHLVEVLLAVNHISEAKQILNDALIKTPDDEYLLKLQQQFLDSKINEN